MNFDLDLGQWIVIGLSAFLLLWYFLVNSISRKRGTAISRWLFRCLESVGEISNAEWIGASNMGARLTVKKAKNPFRRVEAHYLLEPREFLPYWLFNRLKGKRDEVLIRMVLRSAPKGSLEINRVKGNRTIQGDDTQRMHTDFQWISQDFTDDQLFDRVSNFLAQNGETVKRMIIQHDNPHIEIFARINPLLESPAESYFDALLT